MTAIATSGRKAHKRRKGNRTANKNYPYGQMLNGRSSPRNAELPTVVKVFSRELIKSSAIHYLLQQSTVSQKARRI